MGKKQRNVSTIHVDCRYKTFIHQPRNVFGILALRCLYSSHKTMKKLKERTLSLFYIPYTNPNKQIRGDSIVFLTILSYFLIKSKHGELDRIRRSILCDITAATLWPRSSSSSDFMHMYEKRKYIRLHMRNSKHLCSSQ